MISIPRWLLLSTLGALSAVVLTACLSDSAAPTIDLNATPIPGTAIAQPTTDDLESASPTEPEISWLQSIQEPGPGERPSPGVFFLNGPNAWLISEELAVQQVTRQQRVRLVATKPGTMTAAILTTGSEGGREAEEIRIVDPDGNASEPIYGPEIIGDPAGNPRVALLRWSPGGERLAIIREDGSIWLASLETGATPIDIEPVSSGIEAIEWSPNGEAFALIQRSEDDAGFVRIIHVENEASFDIPPLVSFGRFSWLPDPSRILVSEDREAGPNPHAGSIFIVDPDGSARVLLSSAGEFGPAIRIGRLSTSLDGSQLAFTIETPDAAGEFAFQTLHVLDLASGLQRQFEVAPGLSVADIWWFGGGIAWRAFEPGNDDAYTGVEPFAIEIGSLTTGESTTLYRTEG